MSPVVGTPPIFISAAARGMPEPRDCSHWETMPGQTLYSDVRCCGVQPEIGHAMGLSLTVININSLEE